MSSLSIGDLSQAYQTRRQMAQLKSDVARHGMELSTGQTASLSRTVAGDFTPIAGIERALKALDGYRTATSEAATFVETLQVTLENVQSLASGVASGLLLAASSSNPALIEAAGNDARQRFDATIQTLNTRAADRVLLGGVATDGPAMIAPDAMMAALQAEIASETGAAGIEAKVAAWFDSPTGYAAVAYQGSATPLAPFQVGAAEAVQLSVTANDPLLRNSLIGFAMAALVGSGALAGNPPEQASLARAAGERMLTADSGLANLRAEIGSVEARIDEAATRNEAERTALQLARAAIVSVDPFEAASQLEATQTQLETLYTITARLARLNLADFLR